jgi:multidrug efflux pump subunit AcrB
MLLSDISIKRPVFASVLALLLVAFGAIAFQRLALREFPDIDPPVVSVETNYRGAAANVVETRITEPIEQRIAGIEGIDFIESTSENGRSKITITFRSGRDIDAATNDIRDRVAAVLDDLPEEADSPEVQKVDSNDDVVLWLNLVTDGMGGAAAEVIVVEPTGAETELLVDVGGQQLTVVMHGRTAVRPGDGVKLALDVAKCHVFDSASGSRIG